MPDDLLIPDAAGPRLPVRKRTYTEEIGQTGLLQYGGWVQEEFLHELMGYRWRRIVQEMTTNDPVIHAMFFVVELLTRQVDWKIKAASDASEDKQIADFITSNMDDMSQSWKDMISEILTYLPWGYSYHEVVYKLRQGEEPEQSETPDGQEVAKSKHDDGKLGWRKIPIRAQESLERWEFDRTGGIQGMYQQTISSRAFIPIDKSLLFRTSIIKNNPEGRSLCRRVYRPWFYKQRIENIEGIGIERDLAGLPKGKLPAAYLGPNATDAQRALRADFEKIITNIRNDEQAALLVPSDVYPGTEIPQFDVELLSTGGTRQFDINKTIMRYDQRILMTLAADFLLLGHEKVGSFALASSKTELFSLAVDGFLDIICDVFNRHAIPKLVKFNGWKPKTMPMLEHGDVETIDLKELADLISKVSGTKISLSDEEQDWVLEQAGMPVVPGTRTKLREEQEEKDDELAKQIAQGKVAPMNQPADQQSRSAAVAGQK